MRLRFWIALLALTTLPGCLRYEFDRCEEPMPHPDCALLGDASVMDGGADAGTLDAGSDAAAPDAGAPDAGAPDAAPTDAAPPDA